MKCEKLLKIAEGFLSFLIVCVTILSIVPICILYLLLLIPVLLVCVLIAIPVSVVKNENIGDTLKGMYNVFIDEIPDKMLNVGDDKVEDDSNK